MIDTTGTITYVDLEGGFYGIIGDDGKRYNPIGLDAAFREDGMRVRLKARVRQDILTIQMWGVPVEVVGIEPL